MFKCTWGCAVTEYLFRRAISPFLALFLLLSFTGTTVNAQTRPSSRLTIAIVAADESGATRDIIQDLLPRLPVPSRIVTGDAIGSLRGERNTLFIAIGPNALRALALLGIDGAILSAFTSSQALRSIREGMPTASTLISGVYAEPSPASQMQLLALLFKKQIRVAAMLSEKTLYLEPVLQTAAEQAGHALSVERLSGEDSLNRALTRIKDANAILAMPDSTIFNSENIRNILVTTYRRNQAVIGFSTALVNAGALASAISDISDVNAQIAEQANSYITSGKLPDVQYPKYFRVSINEGVARSLNIIVDDQVRNYANKPVVSPK